MITLPITGEMCVCGVCGAFVLKDLKFRRPSLLRKNIRVLCFPFLFLVIEWNLIFNFMWEWECRNITFVLHATHPSSMNGWQIEQTQISYFFSFMFSIFFACYWIAIWTFGSDDVYKLTKAFRRSIRIQKQSIKLNIICILHDCGWYKLKIISLFLSLAHVFAFLHANQFPTLWHFIRIVQKKNNLIPIIQENGMANENTWIHIIENIIHVCEWDT